MAVGVGNNNDNNAMFNERSWIRSFDVSPVCSIIVDRRRPKSPDVAMRGAELSFISFSVISQSSESNMTGEDRLPHVIST